VQSARAAPHQLARDRERGARNILRNGELCAVGDQGGEGGDGSDGGHGCIMVRLPRATNSAACARSAAGAIVAAFRRQGKSMRAASVLAVALAFCGAASAPASGDGELAQMRREILQMAGNARCVNLVQCRVIALGVNPCGGPAEYMVYSWLATDKTALETRIAEYNFLQEDEHRKQGTVGTCAVLQEPVAACSNGRCVLPSP
jgi:hypothetical protein